MEDSASQNNPTSQPQKQRHEQPSNSEILSSAKLMAEAAKSAMGPEGDKVDKAKLAGAAEDLLAAGSHYGNLEETGYGNYVEKAETYLHQYHASDNSSTNPAGHSDSAAAAAAAPTTTQSSTHPDGGDAQSGSKYGQYFKVAEGFLKKE